MRNLDFSSWHTLLSTLLGLAIITLIGVGIRLLAMQTIQRRRERENRQINERLRTLIAAYKTLGGSFTGNLVVDPTHLRDLRRRSEGANPGEAVVVAAAMPASPSVDASSGSDRARRIRDAVEAALSDIILLGTEDQVRLAATGRERTRRGSAGAHARSRGFFARLRAQGARSRSGTGGCRDPQARSHARAGFARQE